MTEPLDTEPTAEEFDDIEPLPQPADDHYIEMAEIRLLSDWQRFVGGQSNE